MQTVIPVTDIINNFKYIKFGLNKEGIYDDNSNERREGITIPWGNFRSVDTFSDNPNFFHHKSMGLFDWVEIEVRHTEFSARNVDYLW